MSGDVKEIGEQSDALYGRAITDAKHGSGAADHIVKAFQYDADHKH